MAEAWVIKAIRPENIAGQFLQLYETDHAQWTRAEAEAFQFPSSEAALSTWRQQSKTVPFRPDGRPNQPLTLFSVMFVPQSNSKT